MGAGTPNIRLYTEVQTHGIHHQSADGLSRECWPGNDPVRTPSTMDLMPDDEVIVTGPRLMSTGGGESSKLRRGICWELSTEVTFNTLHSLIFSFIVFAV